jgi:hypothetical protein
VFLVVPSPLTMTLLAAAVLLFLFQAPPQSTKTGVEGFVLRAGTNEPIPRAQITMRRMSPGEPIPPITTDSQGRFVFTDLDPGSYSLFAQRNGFARQDYGERAAGRGGTPLTLVAGQQMKDVVFRLVPTAAISGRASDPTGEPLVGITIQLLKSSYTPEGRRTFGPVASARTDDRGQYRIFALTPGRYYVSAFADPRVGSTSTFQNEVVESGYVRTYYPGGAEASAAAAIELQPGAEVSAIDFTLSRQKVFRVRGRVFDPRIGRAPEAVSINITSRGVPEEIGFSAQTEGSSGADGTFDFRNVPPGAYWLGAMQFDVTGPGPIGPRNLSFKVTRIPVEVTNSDLDNIPLTFSPGFAVPGRLSFEGGISELRQSQLNEVTVALQSKDDVIPPFPATINPNGAFTLENIVPGDYRLMLDGIPKNYYIKAVRFGQGDALNGFTVVPPVSDALDVILSANASELEGTVLDQNRKPRASAQVVLVPDLQRDRHDLYKQAVSDQNGQFAMHTIVPGDYKIFAWEDIEPYAYTDPDVLRKYESSTIPVRIPESARLSVEAKFIPADQ